MQFELELYIVPTQYSYRRFSLNHFRYVKLKHTRTLGKCTVKCELSNIKVRIPMR